MQNSRLQHYLRVVISTAGVVIPTSFAIVADAQPPQPKSEVFAEPPNLDSLTTEEIAAEQSSGLEYLTRAPLHEAFAEPYDANPTPNAIVNREPPEPIDELPPEYRPSGDDVTWIPGYWSWDDERTDFIWISGVWRDIPPQQRWVPGYWAAAESGFQYVSGFWASDQLAEVAYLPEPPESLEQGAASPSPGDDYFYVPGNWVYQSNDYQWKPGFWSQTQQDWVWVPAQYIWTPSGCVYQNGYWDYDVVNRGVVFTPVYFQQPVYQQPRYTYRPRYTVNTGLGLFVHLFVRPNHRQYYYGDYYGSSYSNRYYPWSTRYQSNRYYDPFFASYRHRLHGGGNTNYISWINNQHQLFANNQQYRPARTISAQRDFLRTNRGSGIDPSVLQLTSIGDSLSNLARSNGGRKGFQQLSDQEIGRFRNGIAPQRQLGRDRLTMETGDKRGRGQADKNDKFERTRDAAGKVAGGTDANRGRDRNQSPRNDASDSGRGRLRLPELDRGAGAVAGNRPRSDRGRSDTAVDSGREGRLDRTNSRAGNAASRATAAVNDPRNNASAKTDEYKAAKPPIGTNVPAVNPSGANDRNRLRDQIERATSGASRATPGVDRTAPGTDRATTGGDRSRRIGAERMRPGTPGNGPTATPGQPGRGVTGRPDGMTRGRIDTPARTNATGRPDGMSRGRTNAPGGAPSGDQQRGRPNFGLGGQSPAGPSANTSRYRANRPTTNQPPNARGGMPSRNPASGAQRGESRSRGFGSASQRGGSPGQAGGGGSRSSGGRPSRQPKDK